MATDVSSLDVFENGIARLLRMLRNDGDDTVITNIILFALQAVATDATKLACLIGAIYRDITLLDDIAARLLTKLLEVAPDTIELTVDKGEREVTLRVRRSEFVRRRLSHQCRSELDMSMATSLWNSRPVAIVLAHFSSGICVARAVVDILDMMVRAEGLFEHGNFDLFVRVLDKPWAKATSENTTRKLMVATLFESRENGWNTARWESDSDTVTQVLTPPESEMELEFEEEMAVKADEVAQA